MAATRVELAGYRIRNTTSAAVTRLLRAGLGRRRRVIVFFVNANFATRCRHLRREIMDAPDILLLNDGFAVDVAARFCAGARFRENLNGTDFTPAFLSTLEPGRRVFLFGARPKVVRDAAEVFGRRYGVEICGVEDGFSVWEDEPGLTRRINAARPDVLLVGLGNPLQEEWILRHRGELEVPIILAVGALFDFASGNVPRAPRALRRLRLEWAYRLFHEPRRLIYRYSIGILDFFRMALFDRRPR